MRFFFQILILTILFPATLANAALPVLGFGDFLGTYRIVRCMEYSNGVPRPGTDICDPGVYPRLMLATSGSGFELKMISAGGDFEALPSYQTFRTATATVIDEASFTGTMEAASWIRRKTWRQTGQMVRQISVVFSRTTEGTIALTMSDLNSEYDPNTHLRRQFTLRLTQ